MAQPVFLRSLAILLLVLPGSAAQSEQNVNPGINDYYLDADYREWVGVFERPGREIFDRRFQIMAAVGARPGMVVADIGAGTGLFTRLFARAVGSGGRVIAVDISRNFVDNILRSARDQGLENVQGVVNSQHDSGLGPAVADLLFVCDTYHHFEYPRAMLASMHRAMKPGGQLVVIDFERSAGVSTPWVLGHVRADREQVIEEIEAAGFELVEERPKLLRRNYFLRFRKGDGAGSATTRK
jgi:SAM-dependent methyltransferase